jgi:hypothetical protein
MATIHTHANEAIVNRFTSNVTLISFRILIFVSLEVSYGWQRVCNREESPVVFSRHRKASERRSDAVDDSRLSSDADKNGMNAAAIVMKASGECTKGHRSAYAVHECASGR